MSAFAAFRHTSVEGSNDGYNSGIGHSTEGSLELATLERVSWLNHHRLLEPIGYIPPAEAEATDFRQLADQTATPA